MASLIRANATRLMLTALRMSSMDMSTITALRRARTPYTPALKRNAPRSRNWLSSTTSVPPGQHDRADERRQEQHRHRLERQQVGGEDRVADLLGVEVDEARGRGHLGVL